MLDLGAVAEKLGSFGKDPQPAEPTPQAAVAALLREARLSPASSVRVEVFFIVRADREGDPWSGHVAFPGGRRDAVDRTLLDTAMRETREEVGFDLAGSELLARLPDVPAYTRAKRGSMVVSPFVFAFRGPSDEPATNDEVAATMWVPLDSLARGEVRETFVWTFDGQSLELPCVYLGAARHRLWGMTLRMVDTLVDAIA